MKIKKIVINNYRLLKNFSIDIEDELSLVIGKNNSGKTSFLSLLEKFLLAEANNFSFEDFNIDNQQRLKNDILKDEVDVEYSFGLYLKMYIQYDDKDKLNNISSLMLNLNPDENVVVLSFEYTVLYQDFLRLKEDFLNFKKDNTDEKKDILFYLKKNHKNYFKIFIKALEYKQEANYIVLTDKKNVIRKIVNFQRIKAKRDVSNVEGTQKTPGKTLSRMSSKYYEKISNDEEKESTKELQKQLSLTDDKLTGVYKTLFNNVIEKVKRFGGIKQDESIIKIVSSLEEKNILKENTSVMYEHNTHDLPEDYNGLGYLNLISMIFEIEVILNDFKKKKLQNDEPADINVLFIEEPEAHTHPQMQYIFIKNIKTLLSEECEGKNDNCRINLQSIISTHSAHITAESNFDDIKYFYIESKTSVIAKNLKSLKDEYEQDGEREKFDFLKQYLTLNRSELFFAHKAIFIEGDTERILLPAIMKKMDYEAGENVMLPLLSQNISIVEVGAYSQVFEKFINFLGIKTLIIADIDSINAERKKCKVADGIDTSNSSLKYFYDGINLNELKSLIFSRKTFSKKLSENDKGKLKWTPDNNGDLCIVYQIEEGEDTSKYHARSFEDSFISLNFDYIYTNKNNFKSLKNEKLLDEKDFYEIASKCIDKKTLFAIDIIYNSDNKFSTWQIPAYIKEGLAWLKTK